MAFWDSYKGQIRYWPDRPCVGYPNWTEIDCGCCAGLKWSGEYPRECRRCNGGGALFRHDASGALAQYPGGPFAGRDNRVLEPSAGRTGR